MSEEMFEEGFQYIHNIDVSSVVIKSMNEKYRDKGPNFKCISPCKNNQTQFFLVLQMDVRSMEYEDSTFDIVVDKGTLDSLLVHLFPSIRLHSNYIFYILCQCGEGSATSASKMLSEIHRVLSPKGVYICISYGIPDHRLLYLEKVKIKFIVVNYDT